MLPVYQATVLADVPLVSWVAVANGGPMTRCGGWPASTSKKLCAASAVGAARRWVSGGGCPPVVSAACRLAAVAAGFAPITNVLVGGGVVDVAVSVSAWVVPSGRLKLKVTVSPMIG